MNKNIEEQIKKIKLGCENHDKIFLDPIDMINTNGTKNYAYVTLVMIGDKYIAGAIVLAESIRKLGSLADLVVLVTNDVSLDGKELLKQFYDHVIMVDYINVENWRTKIQKHRPYLDLVFTKFHVFNLIQYKKILLIDADAIILKYPDHLFTLKTPAGVYLPYKEEFINLDNKGEYIYNKPIEWYNKYCASCSHGKLISKHITDRIEKGLESSKNKNSGISGGLILLEPNIDEFNMILKDIRSDQTLNIIKNKLIWPEQQYLGMRYSGSWTSIDPIFLGLQGYPHWSVLYGLQFAGEKPFILESKFSIEERVKYEDFKLWFYYWREITNRNPDILSHPSVSDSNLMAKYFIAPLSRAGSEIKRSISFGLINSINKLFNFSNIKIKNYYYYHINISKEYDSDNQIYNYETESIINMLLYYTQLYKSEYWNNIYKKIIAYSKLKKKINLNKEIIEVLEFYDDIDRDNLIYNYCKLNNCTNIILIIQKNNEDDIFWIDNKINLNIIYKKYLILDGTILKNILFNIDQKYVYEEREVYLNKKYNNLEKYKLTLLVYKSIFDAKLKGNNDNIYIYSDTNSKIRLCSNILNANTYNKYINNEIIFVTNNKNNNLYKTTVENSIYIKNMLIYQSIKKWIYNNYNGFKIDNIILFNQLNLSDNLINNLYIILDNNDYENDNNLIDQLVLKKLEFIEIIFINNNKDLIYKYKKCVKNMYNPRFYYELDGIKFCI